MSLHREKLKDAIVYIAAHPCVRDLGLTKLYKLIYFTDAMHARESGESITGSEYIKYEHGPVPSRGEKCIKDLRRANRINTEKVPFGGMEMIAVKAVGEPEWKSLSSDELATLDAVCRELGLASATELSRRSHTEPAWIAAPMLEKLSQELMLYGPSEDPDGL